MPKHQILCLTKPYWVEQLLAQFHMVCVLFSNICTLLHSKIHTATAWVTTLSFRWIKLFFLPFSRFFFFHTSLRNDLVLAQISATNWKLYKLRRQRKEEKKVSGRFLFCSAGMEHNLLVENLTVLFWHLTLFVNFVQSCLNTSDLVETKMKNHVSCFT